MKDKEIKPGNLFYYCDESYPSAIRFKICLFLYSRSQIGNCEREERVRVFGFDDGRFCIFEEVYSYLNRRGISII